LNQEQAKKEEANNGVVACQYRVDSEQTVKVKVDHNLKTNLGYLVNLNKDLKAKVNLSTDLKDLSKSKVEVGLNYEPK